MTLSAEQIQAALSKHSFGRASAAKRGRNPQFPWVPIVDFGEQQQGRNRTRTEQIRGKAFQERDGAVRYAQRVIDARRDHLAARLQLRGCRALRRQYGLPEDLGDSL